MMARMIVPTAALLSAFMLALPVAASPESASAYENGLAAYDDCHWSKAVAHFERAAAAGHVRSQEILGLMLFAGPTLYGDAIRRDRSAARRWFDRAGASGSELGALMAKHLAAGEETRAELRR